MLFSKLIAQSQERLQRFGIQSPTSFQETISEEILNTPTCLSPKKWQKKRPDLKEICDQCLFKHNNPLFSLVENQPDKKGLENLLEEELRLFLKTNARLKIINTPFQNSSYPSSMLLQTDNGILAYLQFYYVSEPIFVNLSKRYCYEASVSLEINRLVEELTSIEAELDRPAFYVYWFDLPCTKGIFFNTSEQLKDYLYCSEEPKKSSIIRETRLYPPLQEMGDLEELVFILQSIKKEGVLPLVY